MNKTYARIFWKNKPSVQSPINESNLNKIDYSVDEIDNRIITLDTTKLNISVANTMVKSFNFDRTNGVITVTLLNGTVYNWDLNIEKIPAQLTLTEDGILELHTDDGEKYTADLRKLIDTYIFESSETIVMSNTSQADGKHIRAEVLDGSITEEKLRPDYLADINISKDSAASSAQQAEDVKERIEELVDTNTPYFHVNIETGNLEYEGGVICFGAENTEGPPTDTKDFIKRFEGSTDNNLLIGKNSFTPEGFADGSVNGGNNTGIGINCFNKDMYTNSLCKNTIIGQDIFYMAKICGQIAENIIIGRGIDYSSSSYDLFYKNVILSNDLVFSTSSVCNVLIGYNTVSGHHDGLYNVKIGYASLGGSGDDSTVIGSGSQVNGDDSTVIGSGSSVIGNNTTVIGSGENWSGDNGVILGNNKTSVYAYSALNNLSDKRDKSDIQNTCLGLEFIKKLRPVRFRWDMREDYKERHSDGTVVEHKKNGSKKRNRFHEGFIAQEVKQTIDDINVDFAGYQDHSINGGPDMLTIGYAEFIPPIVKAIQELEQVVKEQRDEIESLKNQIKIGGI